MHDTESADVEIYSCKKASEDRYYYLLSQAMIYKISHVIAFANLNQEADLLAA